MKRLFYKSNALIINASYNQHLYCAASVFSRRWSASFRRADAAQVCNYVGIIVEDGDIECSGATAAK